MRHRVLGVLIPKREDDPSPLSSAKVKTVCSDLHNKCLDGALLRNRENFNLKTSLAKLMSSTKNTERRGRVINTVSNLRGPGFKSRPGDRLS
jgi:hypothetical protein